MSDDEREKLKRYLDAIKAVQAAPAVFLVADCEMNAETEVVEDVPVTQEYIDTLWNAGIDAVEAIEKLLEVQP